ncbi:winged helix-turn-helix transcriptional regulator [Agromyces aurantiacus]|uniref:Winged helix-turn-helix transcriptional regulator n=1 Tax=Agromyces aurantiacus TaxID=165814 RepID=A0ABV9R617_9MICO|nr:helix-turn-helix domain-containing protein [Agromyces aurantiacus]MBM7503407.1 DNA-binding HxlR family transcriptional regulator [Agromyces aurantiacus]
MASTSPAQIERHRSPGAAPLDGPCEVGDLDVLDPDCPSRIVFGRIGERWSMFVILALAGGTLRFTQLRAKVGVVTPKVLTETLRALEADGLVERRAYQDSPPRVEYSLTPLGRSLLEPIHAMRTWAEAHVPEVLESRERHSAAADEAVLAVTR